MGYRLGHDDAGGTSGGTGGFQVGPTGSGTRTGQGASGQNGQTQGTARPGQGQGVITPVQATTAKAGTLRAERRLTGTVAAAQSVTVPTRTSGTVTAVLVGVGANVQEGQTVLRLSNPDLNTAVASAQNALETAQVQLRTQTRDVQTARAQLQQQVNAAQTSLANAEKNLAALQKLAAIGAVARNEVDAQVVQVQTARTSLSTAQANLAQNTHAQTEGLAEAQLAVQKAQINLKQAQDAADAARVTAPFSGQITALNVSEGQYVPANSTAFTLVSRQRQVTVNVPATEAAALPVGAAMTFVVGQQKYPLKVTENPGAPTGGSVPIVARFTGTQTPALGSVGSVVYTAKVATGVLVPSTALQADNEQTYLFTIENGQAQQQQVTVLGQAGTQSAVSGIEAGAQVITQPPTGLLDGARVTTANRGATQQNASGPGAGGPPPGGMP
ncbi:secretion protein HlyD [Deinococcus geothermalis DSM 11300]|uniref:Secretion protein HlyD n=1 Tax=Deinococcus geothermalis (strain DSM 11300 / CIP 105573 / AG-3a) TaxID=319795 RepID=Q1IYF1_DEIGD|nr:secretion protein HlyD [Deinococcus geothermalis DSM 11300]